MGLQEIDHLLSVDPLLTVVYPDIEGLIRIDDFHISRGIRALGYIEMSENQHLKNGTRTRK